MQSTLQPNYGRCRPCCWGLYVKQTQTAVPLKSLDISINIIHNTARVFYTQVYYNEANSLLESEFFFPISPDACFDSFEAKFADTTIKGVIKKKEEAKEEYKEAIAQGRTAAYSEINEETGDIMKVSVGNIPPQTEISIVYSYIQKLEVSLSKFWCFRLFSTITPRYNGNINEILQADISLLADYPRISKNNSQAYPWTIKAEIQSPSPITLLESPTHKIIPTYGNENHTCSITFDPSSISHPNKDFVLLYSNGKEGEKVDYVLTPFEEGYCAMVTLKADFNDKESVKGAYEQVVKPKAKEAGSQYSMKSIKGEYIFLLDRSGSMRGERITMALSSLQLFLRSLPQDSYFNIVSFGSNFNLMHPESVQYSQQTLSSANDQLKGFSANMGGTEIYRALHTVFSAPLKKGYPRSVFLLTDGAVSNTHQVLELIKDNSEKARVFTIGVGNGCSPELITKGASNGKGKHEFVSDSKEIYEKVISLLNASLSPSYSDLSLEATNFDAVVKSVSPNPGSLPFLLDGQAVTFFMLLREAAFDDSQKMSVKLKLYDTTIQDYRTIEAVLEKDNAMNHELIPKLAIHDMMKRLEEAQKDTTKKETDVVLWLNDKEEIKAALIELSLKYGILCKETAFFCDIKGNDDVVKSFKQEKVVVPAITSVDYEHADRFRSLASSNKMAYGGAPTAGYKMKKEAAVMRSAMPQASATLSRRSDQSAELHLASAPMKKSGPGAFSKLASGAVNAVSSLFSGLKGTSASKTLSNNEFESASRGYYSDALSKNERKKVTKVAEKEQEKKEKVLARESDSRSGSRPGTVPSMQAYDSKSMASPSFSGHSYLEAVMKQSFEGYWDQNDTELLKVILKSGKLPEVPSQVSTPVAWMTILVLLWLEVACKNDKNAWALIHQKGSEWLKSVGIEYEDVKNLGESHIKA